MWSCGLTEEYREEQISAIMNNQAFDEKQKCQGDDKRRSQLLRSSYRPALFGNNFFNTPY